MVSGKNTRLTGLRSRSAALLTVFFTLFSISIFAQDSYYIRFTDKDNNGYSISRPEAYLSQRAIDRRRAQHIAIREDDLPLTQRYTDTIASLADHVVYSLRWDNAMLVRSSDVNFTARVQALPFVKSISAINTHGPSTVHKSLDIAAARRLQGASLDTAYYGASQNQNVMIHINALHERGLWGDGVLIAIMDGGFAGAPANQFFAKVYAEGRVLYTWDYVYDSSNVYKSDVHGDETFSCIAANIPHSMVGTAPNAKFLLFNTEDVRSETIVEEYNWAHAAERADSMGADVFSTSLGYNTFDASDSQDNTTYAMLDGHTTPIAVAANKAANKGIIVVNSAGNDGVDAWHYISTPADADSVIAVGAVTAGGSIASFSSRGPNAAGLIKPNVCAQGQQASIVSSTGAVIANDGTSFACPIIAGAMACLRQAFPTAPNMVLADAVQRSANYAANPDNNYGYGIPDFGAAYDYLRTIYPADTLPDRTLVYPDPFSTSITVALTYIPDSPVSMELFDLSGRKLWTTSYPVDTNGGNILSLTPPDHLATGSYVLRINGVSLRVVKKP